MERFLEVVLPDLADLWWWILDGMAEHFGVYARILEARGL